MIATIIYYIVKTLFTLWFLCYCVMVASSHVTFFHKGNGSVRDMFIFASSYFFSSVIVAVLWANEIYHLGGN